MNKDYKMAQILLLSSGLMCNKVCFVNKIADVSINKTD